MFNKLHEKLKNSKGESLAEVLITVLIIAMGLALLASLIMAAGHMMDKGEDSIQELYKGANNIEERADAYKLAQGGEMEVKNSNGQVVGKVSVDIYKDQDSGLKAYYKNQGIPEL